MKRKTSRRTVTLSSFQIATLLLSSATTVDAHIQLPYCTIWEIVKNLKESEDAKYPRFSSYFDIGIHCRYLIINFTLEWSLLWFGSRVLRRPKLPETIMSWSLSSIQLSGVILLIIFISFNQLAWAEPTLVTKHSLTWAHYLLLTSPSS